MDIAHCDCRTPTAKPSLNERPRYYARQLVTADDMILEQDYFRAKLRRHNRFLHGWGVVCGAHVVPAAQPWKVIVKPGYILGPYGDEICIEKDQCLDVRKKCLSSEPQTPPDDCGCTEATPAVPPGTNFYVAIRYVEKQTRLVRVPLGGCGCEDTACEYSRFCDGYEICVLDHCPDSHQKPPVFPDALLKAFRGPSPECPEWPTEPWVVLCEFTVDNEGKVAVQECPCRRHVMSFASLWWSCGQQAEPAAPTPQPGPATPSPHPIPAGPAPQPGPAAPPPQ